MQITAQQMTGEHMVYKRHLHVFQSTILRHSFDVSPAFFSRTRIRALKLSIEMRWGRDGVDGEESRVTEERGGVSLLAGAAWWRSQSGSFLAHEKGS
jgi:hypothetical protein